MCCDTNCRQKFSTEFYCTHYCIPTLSIRVCFNTKHFTALLYCSILQINVPSFLFLAIYRKTLWPKLKILWWLMPIQIPLNLSFSEIFFSRRLNIQAYFGSSQELFDVYTMKLVIWRLNRGESFSQFIHSI